MFKQRKSVSPADMTPKGAKEYKGLTVVDSREVYKMKLEHVNIRFKIGQKIYICSDNDPWYIVNHVEDNVRTESDTLIVIKSWNKYKQYYIYKVMTVLDFMWNLAAYNQLYRDEQGCFVVKETRKKEWQWYQG